LSNGAILDDLEARFKVNRGIDMFPPLKKLFPLWNLCLRQLPPTISVLPCFLPV